MYSNFTDDTEKGVKSRDKLVVYDLSCPDDFYDSHQYIVLIF